MPEPTPTSLSKQDDLVLEEAEVLADFALQASDIIRHSTWRKHGYRSLPRFVEKYTSMTLRRFKQIAEVGDLTHTIGLTRDDLVRIHVDRLVRAMPGILGLLDDGRKEEARDWALSLEQRTYDEISARNRILAPVKRLPRAITLCPHCEQPVEIWSKPSGLSLKKAEDTP